MTEHEVSVHSASAPKHPDLWRAQCVCGWRGSVIADDLDNPRRAKLMAQREAARHVVLHDTTPLTTMVILEDIPEVTQ